MNFCPGSKNSINGKTARYEQNYQRIMSLLQSFIDKNRVNVSWISFIEPIASFHEIQKITKMSFNIPLIDIKDKIHRERTFSIFNC